MKECRCPSCKKLLFKCEIIGKVEIICTNNKCGYHKKPILFDFYPHVQQLVGIVDLKIKEYSTAK